MLLGPDDALPGLPRRVLVAGAPGSGKSTLAARLSGALGLPYTELDGLFHGPGWQPRPEFEAEVAALAARPAWITEWQYTPVRPLLASRCELMVWLDLPRRRVMTRVVRRTVARRVGRTELWNGNREGPLRAVLTDPEHIIRWSWTAYPRLAGMVGEVLRSRPELPVVRLRTPAEVESWTRQVAAGAQ